MADVYFDDDVPLSMPSASDSAAKSGASESFVEPDPFDPFSDEPAASERPATEVVTEFAAAGEPSRRGSNASMGSHRSRGSRGRGGRHAGNSSASSRANQPKWRSGQICPLAPVFEGDIDQDPYCLRPRQEASAEVGTDYQGILTTQRTSTQSTRTTERRSRA